MAFCNMLCVLVRLRYRQKWILIFRQSGLMRDKWDRKTVGYNLRHYNPAKGCVGLYADPITQKQHNDYSISIGEGKAVQAVDEEKNACLHLLMIWAMPTGSLIYSAIM